MIVSEDCGAPSRDQRSYDYSAVCRWTRPKRLKICGQESTSILDCDRVIAPVHLGVHWTCTMADIANQEFVYYDSMGVSPAFTIARPAREFHS